MLRPLGHNGRPLGSWRNGLFSSRLKGVLTQEGREGLSLDFNNLANILGPQAPKRYIHG